MSDTEVNNQDEAAAEEATAAVMAVAVPSNFPIPAPMECKGDIIGNWKFFHMQWEDYEIATQLNTKSSQIRMATLRSIMGKECLRIYQHLDTFDDIKADVQMSLDALEKHFKPAKNVVYERYIFNTCTQGPSESVDQYMTRLRQLVSSCEYGGLEEEMLRDRLILGTKDNTVRARMFREADLTLNRAVNMCRIAEISEQQLQQIGNKMEDVHFTRKKNYATKKAQQSSGTDYAVKRNADKAKKTNKNYGKCKYCGRDHEFDKRKCPAYGKSCKICGKNNHFASVCKQQKTLHRIDRESSSSSESIFHTDQFIGAVKTRGKQLTVDLNLSKDKSGDAKSTTCQLDTGATCNVISLKDYCKITGLETPMLQKTDVRLNLYDGSWMKPLGYCTVYTKLRGKYYKLGFQVVTTKVAQKPLLSANTCQKLNLLTVNTEDANEAVHMTKEVVGGLTKEQILEDYSDVFTGLGQFPGEHHIEIDPTVRPVQHQPRRVPVALKAELKEKIDSMVKQKILRKVEEPTPWISSMVAVKRPNKLRICLDPFDLNKAVKRPKYQMPTIEEVLPNLDKAKVFSVLDAKDGFCHVKLDDESSRLTTFWTPFGRYCWLRLPFGLTSSPEVYQYKQHEALEGLPGVEVIADDILVFGCGDTQSDAVKNHDENLIRLLKRAQKVNLKLNKKKLKLKMSEVSYMGHILSAEGLKPDPEKVKAVLEMEKPKNVKELQRFQGFVTYLSKFAPHLSEVSEPLRRLINKDTIWMWQDQQEEAFNEVKRIVTVQPILKFYSMSEEVTLQCDASEKGLGATILQQGQPIAFASRALSKTEQAYAQIEKECLAIVFGCERFKQYLLGRSMINVESDHKPLEVIFKKSLLKAPKRLQRMLLRLQRFNLNVCYKRGSQMYIADLLSRASLPTVRKEYTEFDVFCTDLEAVNHAEHLAVSDCRLDQIQKCTMHDSTLQCLKTTILGGWPNNHDQIPACLNEYWQFREELTVQNGIIFKGHQIVIPKAMRPELLTRIHSSHLGIAACLRKAKVALFWPHMSSEIKDLVGRCEVCAELKENQVKEPLMTHNIPSRPWSKIALDLFHLDGKEYLITIDYYSDYFEIDLLHSTTTAAVIAKLKPHFARWGIPDEIVTDNGPQFVSDEFSSFANSWEFRHITCSPYNSKSNGKAESGVKIAKKLMKKAKRAGNDIYQALLDWRNTPTLDMECSPAQRLMSRRTRSLLPMSESLLKPHVVPDVSQKIKVKRQKAKATYDQHSKQLPELDIGQPVYVKRMPHSKEPWQKGTLVDKLSMRSYTVDIDGQEYRRNRLHLRERATPNPKTDDDIDNNIPDQPEVQQDKEISDRKEEYVPQRRSSRMKKQTDYYQAGFK